MPESWLSGHPSPHTIRIALVVDDEWQTLFGPDSERESQDVVDEAEKLLAPAGIQLDVVSRQQWSHDDSAANIRQLYSQLPRGSSGSADITVALAAGYKGPEGGFAASDQRHALIKHHPYRSDRDALILTHEIGHSLGLDHHNCSHTLCIMSGHAYDARMHFCPEHLRLLKRNAGYFEYLSQNAQ